MLSAAEVFVDYGGGVVIRLVECVLLWVVCEFRHVNVGCWCAPNRNFECSALYISSLLMFMVDASGDHIVGAYPSMF